MKIHIKTHKRQKYIDQLTTIGLYMNIRDLYMGSILLESSVIGDKSNAHSIICCNAIAGISLKNDTLHYFYPNVAYQTPLTPKKNIQECLYEFIKKFEVSSNQEINGFFGYQSYEAVRYFESPKANLCQKFDYHGVNLLDYKLFQYVICINHFNGEISFLENSIHPTTSTIDDFIFKILNGKGMNHAFKLTSQERSPINDSQFLSMVKQAIDYCKRGETYQIVVSRLYQRSYQGDEFNVYRALRHINPSPYMFYFDYGHYKIFGSSPESQIRIMNGRVMINPIAGTYRRTGNPKDDEAISHKLLADKKELAEHAMLVDLARNDLNRHCMDVHVAEYKKLHKYSHVIHIASQVHGKLEDTDNPIIILADTFPAGTLSGAPKIRAIQLLEQLENNVRGFYGGSVGYITFDGNINQAIIIRSFLAINHELHYRAGAGIVFYSSPESELQEVNHKLGALRQALIEGEKF